MAVRKEALPKRALRPIDTYKYAIEKLRGQKRGTAQTGITTNLGAVLRGVGGLVGSEKRHCPNGHYDRPRGRTGMIQSGMSEKRHCPNGHYDTSEWGRNAAFTKSVRKEALPKRALRPLIKFATQMAEEKSEKRHCPNGHYDDVAEAHCRQDGIARQKRGTAQTGITTKSITSPTTNATKTSEKRHCPNGHYDLTWLPELWS